MMKPYVLIGIILLGAVGANSQSAQQKQRYHDLSRRIYADPERPDAKTFKFPPREEMEKMIRELHDMVGSTILEAISEPRATPNSVREAIGSLQGNERIASWDLKDRSPFVHVVSVNGYRSLMLAFGVMAGSIADVHAYIQFYSEEAGVWKLKGETGSDFQGCMFAVVPLRSGVANQVWYLASGKTIGDNAARLKLRLYGFDGKSVSTVWQRDELLHGGVTVAADGGQITLHYDQHILPDRPLLVRHIEELLRPTFNGMATESLSAVER